MRLFSVLLGVEVFDYAIDLDLIGRTQDLDSVQRPASYLQNPALGLDSISRQVSFSAAHAMPRAAEMLGFGSFPLEVANHQG